MSRVDGAKNDAHVANAPPPTVLLTLGRFSDVFNKGFHEQRVCQLIVRGGGRPPMVRVVLYHAATDERTAGE